MNVNERLVKRCSESSPCDFNKMYWEKLSLRIKDDERITFLCYYGKRCCKIAGGIAAVEASFNCCKHVHNRRRGAFGPLKLVKMLHVKNDQVFLKKFKQ